MIVDLVTPGAGADPPDAAAAGPLPTPIPTPAPAPDPLACADGLDNDADGRVDYPEDRGCRSADDPYEQKGRSWRRLLRELAKERGVTRRQLRREIRGTEQERRLIELGMPQR